MRATAIKVVVTAALLAGVASAFAQKPISATAKYSVPAEHKAFLDEFKALAKRYPDSAARFYLVDLVKPPVERKVIVWKCDDPPGDFGSDCRPEILE